ncbi:hypothetical protein [Kribbella sp. NPDC049227]|uniref:hypothetical protein n=1 Tax=Kribbella sp. NPDC049227 TaxID=3364113 RepID=UPI0037165621
MVIETGIVVGYLVGWGLRKARRVGARADAVVDEALDAALDKLQDAVDRKLHGDPALEKLDLDISGQGQVSERTRQRLELALEDAAEEDPGFAGELAKLVENVRAAEASRGQAAASGAGAAAVAGGVSIRADDHSAAGWNIGNVTFGADSARDSTPREEDDAGPR